METTSTPNKTVTKLQSAPQTTNKAHTGQTKRNEKEKFGSVHDE